MAETLYNLYNNEINLCYLLAIRPILSDVQRINKSFESNESDPTRLFQDLSMLIKSLGQKILLPNSDVDLLGSDDFDNYINRKAYLGYAAEQRISELRAMGKFHASDENLFRQRCTDFFYVY